MTTAAQGFDFARVPLPGSGTYDPDRNKWAVRPLNDSKADYNFGEGWGDGALHHKISKEKLSSMGEQLTPACNNSRDAAARSAAQQFWYLCCEIAGEAVYQAVLAAGPGAAASPKRMLWNLPVMVALGPASPATDPGQNFDADTEPTPGGNGVRRMDAVSTLLKQLEDVWDVAHDAGAYDAALWRRLTQLLFDASRLADKEDVRAGGKLLYRPKYEQWLFDHECRQSVRKGLVVFPGVAAGTAIFRHARAGAPVIAAYKGDHTQVANTVLQGSVNGTPVQLTLTVDRDVVHHVCVRHTTTFFDFSDKTARPRPINTMWQQIHTLADAAQLVTQQLPFLASICLRELNRATKPLAEWDGTMFELPMEQSGPFNVYVKLQITDVDDITGDITAELVTLAPDQATAIGFLREELTAIGKALG